MACQYCMTSAVGRCQYCGPQGAATVAHDWDQLQQQLDALRAEVERLRENSAGLYVSNTQLQARAEAAERERDEAQAQARHWREAAVTENERAMEYLNAVAEAQAHAADLRGALEKIVEMNRQNSLDIFGDPDKAEQWLCVLVARAALASTPAQSLGRVKEKALREAVGTLGVQAPIRTSQLDDFGSGKEKGWEECIELLENMANELEATDGR
jgi:DNA repair exonuclease SbcCD ATPase subunit